ncbi:cellulose synthase [Nocardiopsis sp. HNM0947]|uniref:Cellulose synthase n=1 Tax=Nocardiopsis coralli TaxID=2772213 RepID=A0ABR9P191_9ACTN|nr:cellulose synthase [Nocardiopsis coralli]MBE2997603.1 cellulose synthase [Nocardiopsis coralli]
MATLGLALGAALALVGFVIAFFLWRRKGAAHGLRALSWALVPLAAGLLGLMHSVIVFVNSLFTIVATMVFNPIVWAGTALAGLAVLLYFVSGFMKARGMGVKQRGAKGSSGGGGTPEAGGAAAPTQVSGGQSASGAGAGSSGGGDDMDFGDIEALLKKRGIE